MNTSSSIIIALAAATAVALLAMRAVSAPPLPKYVPPIPKEYQYAPGDYPSVTFSKDGNVAMSYIATIGGTAKVQVMCNLDLTNPSSSQSTCKLLQIVHGMGEDVKSYFGMANSAWGKNPNTLVWGPRLSGTAPDATFTTWPSMGWVRGNPSTGPGGGITSFEVLDAINAALFSMFPSITKAILAGHSAGGQCLARYTGLSTLPPNFPNIAIHYFILSPSTYLWLTPDRPGPTSGCGGFNNWFLGLQNLNAYAAKTGADAILANYKSRNVTAMCGTSDTGTAMLDQSCGANAQGANRYERYKNFVSMASSVGLQHFTSQDFQGGHSISWKSTPFTAILNGPC